jgi:putative DNA primase/helicase
MTSKKSDQPGLTPAEIDAIKVDLGDQLWPAPSDPMAVARRLLTDHSHAGLTTLRHWRAGWMDWQQTHWIEIEERTIRAEAYGCLEMAQYLTRFGASPWLPNRRKIGDVIDAMQGIIHLPEFVDPPCWLDPGTATPDSDSSVVACCNGLLDISTRELRPLTPAFFNRVAVPFDYEPQALAPTRWLEFLDQLWPNDPDPIKALQEFFGYVLSGRTDLHKIMLMVGPARSGKGTIARVLAAMIGKGNVAGPTLASLGTNFGLAPLLGKPLAVVSDARLSGANVHQVVERLLSVSGEDMITVDRKYRDQWTGKLPTRFLILSNELPRFGDASGAIAHRFVVLVMKTSFLGKENTHLTEELLAELPGILGWALDGLDRISRQPFTIPESSSEAILQLQDLVSPVAAFARERCERGREHDIEAKELYAEWRTWAEDNGHHVTTAQTFGRDLRAVMPELRIVRPHNLPRRYGGLRIKLRTTYSNPGMIHSDPGMIHTGAPRESTELASQLPIDPSDPHDPDNSLVLPLLDNTTASTTHHVLNPSTTHNGLNRGSSGSPGSDDLDRYLSQQNGRCSECHWHVEKQGHRYDCSRFPITT